MKLYYTPGTCALAPHIVALEAGLPLDLVKVDLRAKKLPDGGDYLAVNPKGYVPALALDNGDVLAEASILCQYLADQKPDSGLLSAPGTLPRYREMAAFNFIATEIHKQLGALFNPAVTPEMREVQLAVVNKRLKNLEDMLTGDYVMGARFTAPDAYLYTVLGWTGFLKVDLAPYPRIQAYMARVGAREHVQAASATQQAK